MRDRLWDAGKQEDQEREHGEGTVRRTQPHAAGGGIRALPSQERRADDDPRMVGAVLGEDERSRRLRDQIRHEGGRSALGDRRNLPEGELRGTLRETQSFRVTKAATYRGA